MNDGRLCTADRNERTDTGIPKSTNSLLSPSASRTVSGIPLIPRHSDMRSSSPASSSASSHFSISRLSTFHDAGDNMLRPYMTLGL